jgi:hypothetical protein
MLPFCDSKEHAITITVWFWTEVGITFSLVESRNMDTRHRRHNSKREVHSSESSCEKSPFLLDTKTTAWELQNVMGLYGLGVQILTDNWDKENECQTLPNLNLILTQKESLYSILNEFIEDIAQVQCTEFHPISESTLVNVEKEYMSPDELVYYQIQQLGAEKFVFEAGGGGNVLRCALPDFFVCLIDQTFQSKILTM